MRAHGDKICGPEDPEKHLEYFFIIMENQNTNMINILLKGNV